MSPTSLAHLAVCGIAELPDHRDKAFTHVLTLIDPDWPEIGAFRDFDAHERTIVLCHDIIDPQPGKVMPDQGHAESILDFARTFHGEGEGEARRVLIHCQMGVSRSTAAMLALLTQGYPGEPPSFLFERLRQIRPQAWPNSVLVAYTDDLLGFSGELVRELRAHYAHQLRANPKLGDWMTDLGRRREVEMAED